MPETWAADRTERRPVASLVPYARNSRVHSPQQVDQLAASVLEWGWTSPVLIDEAGQIIAGHGRVMAAQKLGLPDVPVMVAVGWSESKKRAYRIADNKIALNATFDETMLAAELADLQEAGINLALTGFASTEIAALMIDASETIDFDGDIGDSGFGRISLKWGEKKVPMSEDEAAELDRLLAEIGADGFAAALLARQNV